MNNASESEPMFMSLDLLREITNDFSKKRKLGSGAYGMVYEGVHQDGEKIAVKVLHDRPGLDEEEFQNEFKNLTRLRHQNIVRLVGYCHDVQQVEVMYKGQLVLAEKTHRALCLEYISNGSLDKYLSDECDKYDWHTGYRIIKGICQGLKYLHDELQPPIYHLDLKPANVLLDENMVPRIADFGLSRLFGDEKTQATKSTLGTIGYIPPEFISHNLISSKFDIYSFGVVLIKIMAGRAGYISILDMSSQEFINLVQENWTNRLHETSNLRKAYSEQVRICIEIGLSCVQEDRHKRPTIQDILGRLNETETKCTYALINQESLGDRTQPGNIYNPNHQQATPSRNDTSSSYNMEVNRNTFPQYAQDPNDRQAEQIYHGSTFNQDIVATTHSNYFQGNAGPREARLDDDSQFNKNDNQECSTDDDPLPGVDGLQIVSDPSTGSTLRACGFPTNGTTFDQDMQNDINIIISRGRADFDVFVLASSEVWEQATLVLTRTGYQINFSHTNEDVIEEKYSPSLQTNIPNGQTTKFILVSSAGVNISFNTEGTTKPNNEDSDVRLRDLIVFVIRTFLNEALDAKRKGKA